MQPPATVAAFVYGRQQEEHGPDRRDERVLREAGMMCGNRALDREQS